MSDTSPPEYVRLHVETAESSPPALDDAAAWQRLQRAFYRATGWPLRYSAMADEALPALWWRPLGAHGRALGALYLAEEPPPSPWSRSPVDLSAAEALADAAGGILESLVETRHALWQREAELAAGVPVVPVADEAEHLARRLEAALESGTTAASADAAGLYLLDDGTSELKLRALWNLPRQRLLDDPIPLRGAGAELEALIGHAVAIDDARELPHCRIPDDGFLSALCVPVSTPSTPLGVLWLLARQPRSWSDAQVQVAELTAGRIAADLEREMLLEHTTGLLREHRRLDDVAAWQEAHRPAVAPPGDLAWCGRLCHRPPAAAGFFDWSVRPDGLHGATVAAAAGPGLSGALEAARVQGLAAAHHAHRLSPRSVIEEIRDAVRGPVPSLLTVTVSAETGRFEAAAAGDVMILRLRRGELDLLPADDPAGIRDRLAAGEKLLLVAWKPGSRSEAADSPAAWIEAAGTARRQLRSASTADLVEWAALWRTSLPGPEPEFALLAIGR